MHKGLLLSLLLLGAAGADELYPKASWADRPDPLASTQAVSGGTLNYHPGGGEPSSFNYYLENSASAAMVFGLMYESLLGSNGVTLDNEPGLAARWSISDDKLTFTFWLDPRAKWSDGLPVTADDVKWTYDTVMKSPKTAPFQVDLGRLEKCEVLDLQTVRFRAKFVHWSNLDTCGGFPILPRHVFADKVFEEVHSVFPAVSGPYRLASRVQGSSVTLEKRPDWWGRALASNRHKYNFDRIVCYFYENRDTAFEAFNKGQIDIFPIYTSRQWVKETSGERYERNWIVKQRVDNYNPIGFQGFAMNTRRKKFADLKTRLALAHLLNRDKLNEQLMYSQYKMHRSYFEDLYSPANPCPIRPVPYDKAAARRLLAEAGWKANPKTGILERDGEPFVIEFLERDTTSSKFLAIYMEDLKDVGIELREVIKDWQAWVKDMDDNFNFDMTWAAWSAGVRKDPEGLWSSVEAAKKGSNNYPGFKSAKVDALIEQSKTIFDIQQRHELVRQIDALIAEQTPYVLLWYIDYTRLLYWNKFGMPDWVLGKYGDVDAALVYWWYDADSEADLKDAMAKGTALPKRPFEVQFDSVFKAPPAKP